MNIVSKVAIISFFVSSLWLIQFMDCCMNLFDVILFFGGYIGILTLPPYLVWVDERMKKHTEVKQCQS